MDEQEKKKLKKKALTLDIITKIIQWLPIGLYGCFNIKQFYSEPQSGITFSAILLIGAILCFFKDSFKTWITKPSVFKYSCIIWVISLICIMLGDQMFLLSTILLASNLASIPTSIWEANVKKEALEDSAVKNLKELILGKNE